MAATRTASSMSDRFPRFFLIILVIWSPSPSFKTTNSLRSQSSETWSLEAQRVRLNKVLKNHAKKADNNMVQTWFCIPISTAERSYAMHGRFTESRSYLGSCFSLQESLLVCYSCFCTRHAVHATKHF